MGGEPGGKFREQDDEASHTEFELVVRHHATNVVIRIPSLSPLDEERGQFFLHAIPVGRILVQAEAVGLVPQDDFPVGAIVEEDSQHVANLQGPLEAVVLAQIKERLGEQVVEAAVRAHGDGVEEKVHDGLEVCFVAEKDGLGLGHQVPHKREPVGEDAGDGFLRKAMSSQLAHSRNSINVIN